MKDETEIFKAKRGPKIYPAIEKRRKALIELMRPLTEAMPLEVLFKQDGFNSLYEDHTVATLYDDLSALIERKKAYRHKVKWQGNRAVWGYFTSLTSLGLRPGKTVAELHAPYGFVRIPEAPTGAPEPAKRKLIVDTSRLDSEGVINVVCGTYDVDVKI